VAETREIALVRRAGKPVNAFRTIGEAADELDLPPHVLRFWESKFQQLTPLKRGGGRRYYRPEDMALLRRIRQCLYQEGYTIRGVQKLLNDREGTSAETKVSEERDESPTLFPLDPLPEPTGPAKPHRSPVQRLSRETKTALAEIRRELVEARALLDSLTRQL
jgi:DNA-binding transcriptional MerR regulator